MKMVHINQEVKQTTLMGGKHSKIKQQQLDGKKEYVQNIYKTKTQYQHLIEQNQMEQTKN